MNTITKSIQSDEDRYQLPTYAKFPISIERGQGCYVYDQEGEKYLDFYAGHAVASTGHCHPRVVEAIQEQASRLIFYSNVAYNGVRARAVRKLVEMAGQPYYQAFLVNSGSEANENAIKLARAISERREMISTVGSFHGRSYGALSSTGIPKYANYLNTPVPRHRILPMGEVAAAVSTETAAVLIEPIQSMAGVREILPSHLSQIHQACKKHGALLIFDEVQTGVARTGSFLYAGRENVYPDMVTLAKGIASGFPAGALLVTGALAKGVEKGDLGTTFGGGPLACAAMEATLEVIEAENVAENAARVGAYLKEALCSFQDIEQVQGRGLLLGLKLAGEMKAKDLQKALLDRRILTGTSVDPQVLRLMPPLTLTQHEADVFVEAVKTL
ncbi:aminotransferase class III-fold pyridoxal phosphate-dependent enzyme [Acidobacteria bacterium AH-259-O06]|nr:aminotransferase class III-fold pyridoxal phosphate-dependent enzyme [Acidobacteria bacterium AH-259-O06]